MSSGTPPVTSVNVGIATEDNTVGLRTSQFGTKQQLSKVTDVSCRRRDTLGSISSEFLSCHPSELGYVKNTILQYSDVLSSDSLKRLDRIAAANRPTCAPNREKSLKKKKFSSKLQLGVKRVMSSPTCTIKLGGYVFVGADDNYRPPHMSTTEKQSGTDENSSSEMTVYMGSYRNSHRDRVPFDNILDESKYNDNSTTEEETCITLNDIQTIVKQTPPKSINVVSCHTCVALVKETATVHYISWEYVTVQHLESTCVRGVKRRHESHIMTLRSEISVLSRVNCVNID
uniref:Uncharacterized protein n=1 Tax=Timema cristinae TaxID=61476 RepID=A0A7R9D9V1_TIMCR|nr:unnamed protein product [Timema cristinae]